MFLVFTLVYLHNLSRYFLFVRGSRFGIGYVWACRSRQLPMAYRGMTGRVNEEEI